MHETYRMLGREHEADLDRWARRRDLAAEARRDGRHRAGASKTQSNAVLVSIAAAPIIRYLGRARIVGTAFSKTRREADNIGAPSDVVPVRRL
jgi:hypothetical protein